MSQSTPIKPNNDPSTKSTLELARMLGDQCAIAPNDWHRLKSNRKAQANQHITAAIVYLQSNQTEEALAHLQQAVGWLDRSISAPPCPTHGKHHSSN